MNKLKTISSISLGVAVLSLSLPNSFETSALSNSLYTLTEEDYEIYYLNNTLTLAFDNATIHNNVTDIELKDKNGRYLSFDKNSEDFTLELNNGLNNGIYYLVFSLKTSNSQIKELISPIYINFSQTSSKNLSVTSLNPIVSITNINGVNKLNARFTVLNTQEKIHDARILDSNLSEIGYLENASNPRNYVFNLGSNTPKVDEIYYIEYTLEDLNNEIYTVKVPFTHSSNSVQLNQTNTNAFTYTSYENSNKTIDLTLDFKGIDNKNVTLTQVNNYGVVILPSYDNNGRIVLKNIEKGTMIQANIKNLDGKYTDLIFKVPDKTQTTESVIPFLRFVNAPSLILKRGTKISLPLIKDDLISAGLTTPNTYLKFVTIDNFGTETDLTDEVRVSTSMDKIDVPVNTNIETLSQGSQVYVKVYNPTKSYLFPFSTSNTVETTKSSAFDVIKSSTNLDSVSLTFRPNSNILGNNETFSNNDILILNDSIQATLSPDKKTFSINTKVNNLINGVNTYTFIRNSSSGNAKYVTGEFLALFNSSSNDISPAITDFNIKTNNSSSLIFNLTLNQDLVNSGITKNSIKIYDEFGTSINMKTNLKQNGTKKYYELIIDPPSQLVPNRYYTIEFSNGLNSFESNFIYNNNTTYNPRIDLSFNSASSFTLKNLNSIPGYSNYEFNIRITDYYNKNNVFYENFTQSYYGEKLNQNSITRNLNNGKSFYNGDRYLLEISNITTGDTYKTDFTFRDSDIINSGTNSSQINISSSSIINTDDKISFSYLIPNNKSIATVITNTHGITGDYSNNRITLDGIIPNKIYTNLRVTVNFKDGTNQSIILSEFKTNKSSDELKNYISKVYTTALTPINETNKYRIRYADEEGFKYWYDMLYNKKMSGPEFIYRVLDSAEFNKIHTSPQNKIRALYPIVTNREGDNNGITYWINELNQYSSSLNSEKLILEIILTRMLNEDEPKRLFQSLGIRLS
ncbi:hypothetical protein [Candidatus Arthromitus sp. SFB-rat-Yit]|uniref:hypothetical protein n=1 Tax=Candidatus Arthromitus sp. SFB-rat-Yit TaxID=1041504 RepID=UPI000227A570|nr:hypothetical protein [Candidatus Arthromitus sp. SFB-rat-Yit]BAK81612.1 hypothetical protein RATSFB_1050 [Candidatus Arthromitus sp. SFB-rat-Yit]